MNIGSKIATHPRLFDSFLHEMIVFHRFKMETLSPGELSPGMEQEKTREIKQNQDTIT
jgi:hypothetical protein